MVTLDIEDTYIRMVVVKGRRVEKAARLPLEPGLVKDGVIIDTAKVSQQIKEFLAAHDVVEKEVVASISGIHSVYRVVSIPRLPKKMLDEAARREMERVTPIPLNELYTSWQAISSSDTDTIVCLVGLPRSTVDAMLETLFKAGLKSQVMDIKPLALARVSDEKEAIIINAQLASFDIVVMIDGIPELLRSLSFPTRDMTPIDRVALIKEELDRTVAFYNSSHKGNSIPHNMTAFVSGELREMLIETLGYPVKPLPELLSYPDSFDVNEYVTNIGLALKQVKVDISQALVNIDVIREVYLPKHRSIIEIASWALIIIAISVLIPLAIPTLQAIKKTSALKAQVDNAQIQVQARQVAQPILEKLQKKLKETKATRDTFQQPLNSFKLQRAKINGDLSKVTSLLPGIVNLKTITYSGSLRNLRIDGTAAGKTTILDYKLNC